MFIKVMETLLDNKFLAPFLLYIRAWSTETQGDIALFSYSGVWTCSALLVSLYTYWKALHWKDLKLSFFYVFKGYRKSHVTWSGFKDSQKQQMFFKVGVLKNFAISKEKHLSLGLFVINLQVSSPAALLKRGSISGIFLWILQNFQEQLFL